MGIASAWLMLMGLMMVNAVRNAKPAPVSLDASIDYAVRQRLSVERARREYPDLWDEGSPLRRAASSAYDAAVESNDDRLGNPEFPYALTRMIADEFGIEPVK